MAKGDMKMRSQAITQESVAGAVSGALRRTLGSQRCAVKQVARRIGRDIRAVRGWWEGENAPRAADLILLMSQFEEVYEAVATLAGRGTPPDSVERQRIEEAIRILRG